VRGVLVGAATALVLAELLLRAPTPGWRHPPIPRLTRTSRRALAASGLLAAGLVTPVLPVVVVLGWWVRRRAIAPRQGRARTRAVRRALPEVVDLLVLASSAGLSLPIAHPLVARHGPPPIGDALQAAHAATAAGRPRADALLDHLAPLGERSHALAHVLVDHLRYGVPLLPALERTSLELRLDRRRAAELDARRVPVRLLAPLVACVLPAFGLLTVVPLLAASLDALPT
jgi:tight adherence protein C